MSIAAFIIFIVSSVGLLNTTFAPSIGFREDKKHKETKRFFILLIFNILLIVVITLMLFQNKALTSIKI